jgi:hypothetical protein
MSTMFPNGLLMDSLLDPAAQERAAHAGLAAPSSALGLGPDVFRGIDYSTMVDDPQTAARALGLDPSLSWTERVWMALIAGGACAVAIPMIGG